MASVKRPTLPAWRPAPTLVAAGLAAAVVLLGLRVPLVEDGLFWWVPKGLWMLEHGPSWSAAGELPTAVAGPLAGHDPLPQWGAGLPDWDHPPLWYLWLALFLGAAPTVTSVHLACLAPAVLAATGWVAVATRLGRPWAGLAPLFLPPVVAQLLRPDLDLPLLAVVPWTLAALLDRRWAHAAVLGLLAPWVKEPGVLLVVPGLLAALPTRRPGPLLAGLSPLLGLGLWRLVHGHLAAPERLPDGLSTWLQDLLVVGRLALWDQGRWVLLLALPFLVRRLSRLRATPLPGRVGLVAAFALTWLAFFAAVGFFATAERQDALTHVRYFLPGLAALAVLLASALPAVALPGLLWMQPPSPHGPEGSLWGLQAALAERDAAPWIARQLDQGTTVWVGSYQAAALLQPWAGHGVAPLPPRTARGGALRVYAYGTDPALLQPGSVLVQAAYGEPVAALLGAVSASELGRWSRGQATVIAWRVDGPKSPAPLPSGPGARTPGSR